MTKTTVQQTLFDMLEALETSERPYLNGLGESLPWESPVRRADTLSKPYHNVCPIDALEKRDNVKAGNRLTTTSVEDRARALSFFDGKNYETEKRQGVEKQSSQGRE